MAKDRLRDYDRKVSNMQNNTKSIIRKIDSAIQKYRELDAACAGKVRNIGTGSTSPSLKEGINTIGKLLSWAVKGYEDVKHGMQKEFGKLEKEAQSRFTKEVQFIGAKLFEEVEEDKKKCLDILGLVKKWENEEVKLLKGTIASSEKKLEEYYPTIKAMINPTSTEELNQRTKIYENIGGKFLEEYDKDKKSVLDFWDEIKKLDPGDAGLVEGVLTVVKSMTIDLVAGVFTEIGGIIENPNKKLEE